MSKFWSELELDEWETRESGRGYMPLCLCTPVAIRGDLEVAERVTLLSVRLGWACERTRGMGRRRRIP